MRTAQNLPNGRSDNLRKKVLFILTLLFSILVVADLEDVIYLDTHVEFLECSILPTCLRKNPRSKSSRLTGSCLVPHGQRRSLMWFRLRNSFLEESWRIRLHHYHQRRNNQCLGQVCLNMNL